MNNSDSAVYLYHYTSVEILALILKNHTFRLNPLSRLDDLQEQITADVKNLGDFVFVSSWTSNAEESIPMWRMYTKPTAGVRIKLRKNPFISHSSSPQEFAIKTGLHVDEASLSGNLETFLDLGDLINGGIFSPQAWSGDILKKVIYTNDMSLLEPKVSDISEQDIQLFLGKLGRHKSEYWRFQEEWRYVMQFIPLNFKGGPIQMEKDFQYTVNRMLQGVEKPPISYFDLTIRPDCYSEMEIMCSPQISAGNRLIVDDLVEKYNPSAKVSDSFLYGKL